MAVILQDPYDAAILVSGILLLLIGVLLLLRKLQRPNSPFPYAQKPFGNELRRRWLPVIQAATGDDYQVLPAVRLEDLLTIAPGIRGKAAQRAAERLAGRGVDFVLLAPGTLDPLAVILLESENRQESFTSAALLAGGLPVVCLPAEPLLAVGELRQTLQGTLGAAQPQDEPESFDDWVLGSLFAPDQPAEEWSLGGDQPPPRRPEASATSDPPAASRWSACPDCGSPREPRRVNRGRHAGSYFLVCQRYPACQQLQPLKRRQA